MKGKLIAWGIVALAMLLVTGVALATGGTTHYVCHANARAGLFDAYQYLEVGGLSGHFYGGNPSLPRHGAWDLDDWRMRWDFVTVQGDQDCDGEPDYQTCDETVAVTGEPVWGEWGPWILDAGTGLETRYRDGTQQTDQVDARDGETVCSFEVVPLSESETREYGYCETTGEPIYGEWSEWAWDVELGTYTRQRSVTTYDGQDAEHLCGSDTEIEYGEVPVCEYDQDLPADSPACEPPVLCAPINQGTWYECTTGFSTYTGTSFGCAWCQGWTGRVHYHVSYDCGRSFVEEGSWPEAPDTLGYYPCGTSACEHGLQD